MPAIRPIFEDIEAFLERERGQLPLWLVACFGAGIAAWFALPARLAWAGFVALAGGVGSAGVLAPAGSRLRRALWLGGLTLALGCGWIWLRADQLAAPRLDRPVVVRFAASVEAVEPRPAQETIRLLLRPSAVSGLPPRVRVSVDQAQIPSTLGAGSIVVLRARLQGPPPMALPGTHDFARDAWFARIGAVGKALDPPTIVRAQPPSGLDSLRLRLGAHIRDRLPGSEGGIAVALANGDQAGVAEPDADAMRRSGLTHLLSVSGLHIAAVIAATMLLTLRMLALSPRLALRFNLVLVAALAGALAGISYTILTGMQVPTVRSCLASVLVLIGIALGREAISLRLIAVGALAVMLARPEAVAGPSFQLSFAAVIAIVVFHSFAPVRRWLMPREETWLMRLARSGAGLLATGLAVEVALMPIAFYHFHRSGLLGVLANLFAIPWTTFVIMPSEAAALLADSAGLGAPLWQVARWSIRLLLEVAHRVGDPAGAVALLPGFSRAAFAAIVVGGLWVALWNSRIRWLGLAPVAFGAIAAAATPVPDLLITGDGRHLAVVRSDGTPALLRDRAGDYIRDLLAEVSAYDGDPIALEGQPFARCTRDSCVADLVKNGRGWRLLAIRSKDRIAWADIVTACRDADIVVAERRLPAGCVPRWLKLDGPALRKSGGVAIVLGNPPRVSAVADQTGAHPWALPPAPFSSAGSGRPGGPGWSPGRGDNAGPRNGDWRGRGGSSGPRGDRS